MCLMYIFCTQWGSLSKMEKAVYFMEAEKRKKAHQLENPGWTNKANYVSTCRSHIFKLDVKDSHRTFLRFSISISVLVC